MSGDEHRGYWRGRTEGFSGGTRAALLTLQASIAEQLAQSEPAAPGESELMVVVITKLPDDRLHTRAYVAGAVVYDDIGLYVDGELYYAGRAAKNHPEIARWWND